MAEAQHNLVRAMGSEAAKAAPPTVVAAYGALTAHLPELVGFATLIYILIQAGHLIWKWWCQIYDRRRALAAHKDPPPMGDEA